MDVLEWERLLKAEALATARNALHFKVFGSVVFWASEGHVEQGSGIPYRLVSGWSATDLYVPVTHGPLVLYASYPSKEHR